jgi:hypothetical protein
VPLGRRFRALKLWFVLRTYGRAGLQAYLRHHLALAAVVEGRMRADSRFELAAPPRFALVCFRLKARRPPLVETSRAIAGCTGASLYRLHSRSPHINRAHGCRGVKPEGLLSHSDTVLLTKGMVEMPQLASLVAWGSSLSPCAIEEADSPPCMLSPLCLSKRSLHLCFAFGACRRGCCPPCRAPRATRMRRCWSR